jgi:hypothetical protein
VQTSVRQRSPYSAVQRSAVQRSAAHCTIVSCARARGSVSTSTTLSTHGYVAAAQVRSVRHQSHTHPVCSTHGPLRTDCDRLAAVTGLPHCVTHRATHCALPTTRCAAACGRPQQPHCSLLVVAHTQHTQQRPLTALICTRIWWLNWTVASVDCRMTPVRSPSASSASHPSINRRRSAAAAAETDATEVAAAAAASCRFATRRSVAQRCACGIARCPQCVHAPSYPCWLRILCTADAEYSKEAPMH